jgi:Iap family predicted aminopeptidase
MVAACRGQKQGKSLGAKHKEREVGKVEKLLRKAKRRGKGEVVVQPREKRSIASHGQRKGKNQQASPEEPFPVFALPEKKESGQEGEETYIDAEEPGNLSIEQGLKTKLSLRTKEGTR